jgi:DNA-binding XRE family transcriptional regulator
MTRILPRRLALLTKVKLVADLPEIPEPDERARLRQMFKVTQQEIADYVGVQRETVNRWESGKRSPGSSHYFAYCAFYTRLIQLEKGRASHPSSDG